MMISLHSSRWYQLCGGGRGVYVVMLADVLLLGDFECFRRVAFAGLV